VAAIRDVLAEAISAGGSSLRDHKQTDGELGLFQHNFRVYDREGSPCSTPGCNGTIKRIVQTGRSTFFVRCVSGSARERSPDEPSAHFQCDDATPGGGHCCGEDRSGCRAAEEAALIRATGLGHASISKPPRWIEQSGRWFIACITPLVGEDHRLVVRQCVRHGFMRVPMDPNRKSRAPSISRCRFDANAGSRSLAECALLRLSCDGG